MGALQSPGVQSLEIDLTGIISVPAGVTGAFSGAFEWGPVMEPVLVHNEGVLLETFGIPIKGYNRRDWFSVAKFLEYSNQVFVVRVVDTAARNAIAGYDSATVTASNTVVKNKKDYEFNFTNPDGAVIVAKYPGEFGNGLQVDIIDSASFGTNQLANLFDTAPTGTEVHVVVSKDGEILELFEFLNLTPGTLKDNGSPAYVNDVLDESSKYVYAPGTVAAGTYTLDLGVLGAYPGASRVDGYDLFLDKDSYDVSLIFAGETDSAHIINQKVLDVAASRKDAIGYISPQFDSVKTGGSSSISAVISDRNSITGDSYGFMDSNWGLIYDKYNKSNVWIPLNAVSAGLTAKTEVERDAWFAPAGYNRGKVKGVTKLAWEQSQAIRDQLYKAQVNPVTTFKGEGIVLFGQKTLQARPSAFDRLNVRRLFIVLTKAIERAAKYKLFEMNNDQTCLLFRTEVNQFLRQIQAAQGIYDYRVVCDETNNTPQIIDSNAFVADIYVKPSRAISFIYLNFAATPTGLSFEEIIGS